jgi:hypothetical protein
MWRADRRTYVASGQTPICGEWTNTHMWRVDRHTYVASGQAHIVNSIPAHGEVYSIQLYVIKFLSDLNNYIHVKTKTALNICLELSYASFPNHTQFLNICHGYLEWRMYMYIYIYITIFISKVPDIILCIIYPLSNSYQLMMHDSDKEM